MPEMSSAKLAEIREVAEQFAKSHGWNLGKNLGSGGSAAVFYAHVGEQELAVKVYDKKFFDEENGPAEQGRIRLQEQLIGHNCPSLIQVHSIEFTLGTCFVVMEYVAGDELSKCIDRVPRTAIWPLVEQLVAAVRFLDDKGLVHRDIKPHNIIVSHDFMRLKLIDLGVVREVSATEDRPDGTDHGRRRPFVATAQYSSPEYLFRLEAPSMDLWKGLSFYQIGAVLHDLIMRRQLFADEVATDNRYAVAMAVLKKIPSLATDEPVDAQLKILAAHCLTKDLRRRLHLVNWGDFQPRGQNPAKELARRLEQLSGARVAPAEVEHEKHRQELARHQSLERLLTQLNVELKDAFTDMHCEQRTFKGFPHAGLMRFRVPQLQFVLDVSIEAKWADDEEIDQAAICIAAIMKDVAADMELTEATHSVGVLYANGTNLEVSVSVLTEAFIYLANKAIDQYQTSGVLTESAIISI